MNCCAFEVKVETSQGEVMGYVKQKFALKKIII